MADQLLYAQSMPKTDRSKLSEYPTLSLKERERRWGLVRNMMTRHNLEALITIPGGAWDDPSNYLTNYLWPRHGITVFFPLQGEPVAFGVFHLLAVDTLLKSETYGIASWIHDWRFAQNSPETWIALLKERGLTRCRIGMAANGHFSRAIQMLVANALMGAIKAALPDVTFVDVWDELVDIWIVKEQEEIAMFRKAALATEVASEEFVLACKPGNTVADVQNAFMSALVPYGIDIWRSEVSYEPDGGRGILWMGSGTKPPVIQNGHLVCTEFFAYAGPLHAQAQITVSVGEPSAEKKKLATVARECYEIALKTLRPGITFETLANAVGEPLKREGLWHLSPLAHTMNPHAGVTNVTEGIRGPVGFSGVNERFGTVSLPEHTIERPDLLIREGMVLQFEPNACKGRTYVNIGGNVLVTKDGCEELNSIPTRMVVVPV